MQHAQAGRSGGELWLGWVLANGLSVLLGGMLTGMVLSGTDSHVDSGFAIILTVFVAPVLGIVGGLLQWVMLRGWLPSAWRWLVASAVAGIAVTKLLSVTGALNLPWGDRAVHPLLSAAIGGGLLGAVFGLAQVLVLRGRYSFAWWWPGASILAWFAAAALAEGLLPLGAASICSPLVPGAVTGLALVLILRYPTSNARRESE